MTHNDWTKAVQSALALGRRKPAQAVARLQTLARTAERSRRDTLSSWHTTQALGLAASILSDAGHHREAASAFRAVAKVHEQALREHGHALVSSLESAALELFEAGEAAAAMRLARKALSHFGSFPDPSTMHEDVVRRVRAHAQNRASERRRGRAGQR